MGHTMADKTQPSLLQCPPLCDMPCAYIEELK